MKKVYTALKFSILIILTGCALTTPKTIPTPKTSKVKKEPVKIIFDKKEELFLDIDVKHLLTLKDDQQLTEYVKVRDRKGNLVTHLPVKNGQIEVFMDFTPNLLELRYKGNDVPISIVVYHVCSILEKDVINSRFQSSFRKFNSVEELHIEEICWNNSLYSWEFKFSSKTESPEKIASSK